MSSTDPSASLKQGCLAAIFCQMNSIPVTYKNMSKLVSLFYLSFPSLYPCTLLFVSLFLAPPSLHALITITELLRQLGQLVIKWTTYFILSRTSKLCPPLLPTAFYHHFHLRPVMFPLHWYPSSFLSFFSLTSITNIATQGGKEMTVEEFEDLKKTYKSENFDFNGIRIR